MHCALVSNLNYVFNNFDLISCKWVIKEKILEVAIKSYVMQHLTKLIIGICHIYIKFVLFLNANIA